jgi:hypothetical protein
LLGTLNLVLNVKEIKTIEKYTIRLRGEISLECHTNKAVSCGNKCPKFHVTIPAISLKHNINDV